ncbi:nuclear transport factor 2 family protein [Kribbella sp. NPDC051587]|uniref:nuclear transport factor 2 family protein n=1 Tax=Kribbella sp. NPDC051587 TaxID=3364119 RepID=UPI0037ABC982
MRTRTLPAALLIGALVLAAGVVQLTTSRPADAQAQTVKPGAYDVAALNDLEAIKQLKARYCRLLDTKQWGAWRQVFTDDFVSDTSDAGGKVVTGGDEFVAFVRQQIGQPSQTTVHQVQAPEITLTSATTATGIWALEDTVDLTPAIGMHGAGHYHETYVKIDGQWRIKTSKLTRLRQEIITPATTIPDLKKALAKGRRG